MIHFKMILRHNRFRIYIYNMKLFWDTYYYIFNHANDNYNLILVQQNCHWNLTWNVKTLLHIKVYHINNFTSNRKNEIIFVRICSVLHLIKVLLFESTWNNGKQDHESLLPFNFCPNFSWFHTLCACQICCFPYKACQFNNLRKL